MYIDDRTRILHMRDSAREARDFIKGRAREDLEEDRLLVLAVVKALEVIGEAASKVSRNYRDEQPQIPWQSLIVIRNRLTHDYYDYDLDKVWTVALDELDPLLAQLDLLVQTEQIDRPNE